MARTVTAPPDPAAETPPSDQPTPADQPTPSDQPADQPAPDNEPDLRPIWVCVEPEGPRRPRCPAWRSNNQLIGKPLTCPTCGSWSAIRNPLPGEDVGLII